MTGYATSEDLKTTSRCEDNTFCSKSANLPSSHSPHNMARLQSHTSTYVCQLISMVVFIILLASIFHHFPNIQAASSLTTIESNNIIAFNTGRKWETPRYIIDNGIPQETRQKMGHEERYQDEIRILEIGRRNPRTNRHDFDLALRERWARYYDGHSY